MKTLDTVENQQKSNKTHDTLENHQTNWWKRLIHSKINKKSDKNAGYIRKSPKKVMKTLDTLENQQKISKTHDTLENHQKK